MCLRAMLIAAVITTTASAAEPDANTTIRGKVGSSEIIITTTARLAGAIHSLTWNGKEFIDSVDHGRQLQSAANFDAGQPFHPEIFNPTEAGSRHDGAGPRSTSKLLRIRAERNELDSTIQMAFWLRPGEKSAGHLALNREPLSQHLVRKRVTIGYQNLANVIQYDVTFTVPDGEHHRYAAFEAVTGYMPPEFSKFWALDLAKRERQPLSDGPGEQRHPVILATEDGRYAMGVFSPDQPSKGFETAGYGRFRFVPEKVVKWNCVFRVRDDQGIRAGDYSFRQFIAVGTLDDVQRSLLTIHAAANAR